MPTPPHTPLMHGEPAGGLWTIDPKRVDQVREGRRGEIEFALSLHERGWLDRFSSFWSMNMPDADDPTRPQAGQHADKDLDAALLIGDELWLIDVKRWSQKTVDAGGLAGTMAMVRRRFEALTAPGRELDGVQLRAFVVFAGEVDISKVEAVQGVHLMRQDDFLENLHHRVEHAATTSSHETTMRVVRLLSGLIKPPADRGQRAQRVDWSA